MREQKNLLDVSEREVGEMFDNLIETKPRKPKTARQFVLSIAVHTILIGGAVYGTLQAREDAATPATPDLVFAEMPPPQTQPKRASDVVAAPAPPKGFRVLIPPVSIPDVLPDIDLRQPLTDDRDFTGKGVQGGVGTGIESGRADDPFRAFEVDKTVAAIPGNPAPRYPDMLRSANIEGEILAQFVVDTTGRVDMSTFKVLQSTHELFTNAVRLHLSLSRYYPAEIGSRRVKQLVQQPFNFALTK